jgi:ATP-dependent Clp protease protease subunit
MDLRDARRGPAQRGSLPPGWPPRPPEDGDGRLGHRPPLDEWLQQRLFDQRIVLVRGHLDGEAVGQLTAQLVALNALGGHRITMHLDSPDGDLDAALLLVDTMDALRVPVHAVATGSVGGASLGVLAAAHSRSTFPHARFRLAEPRVGAGFARTVDQTLAQARMHEDMLGSLVRRLALVTLKSAESIQRDLREGRYLTAPEAVEYGLVDAITTSGDVRDGSGSGFTAGTDDAM